MKAKVILFFLLLVGSSVHALKISDFYQSTKVGQWILMKSNDGLLTRTAVIAKGDDKLTFRVTSFEGKKQISDSEQVIDLKEARVIAIRIYENGKEKELYPDGTEMDGFLGVDFRAEGEEGLAIEKGFFPCKRYKGIFRDRVVKAWISDDIPILHLVKISMQGVSVQLVDYGN